MLTRLRVKGFKNLLDIEVRFGPFTCVTGKNAVGKSNLFDALRFLHLLTRHPIMEAVRLLREAKGRSPEPRSLFTSFGSYRTPEMRFTADLLIDRRVEDNFGVAAEAAISSVRYEVAFRLNQTEKPERLELVHESLEPRTLTKARKELGFKASKEFKESVIQGRRVGSFISTTKGSSGDAQIKVHQEGHGGREVPAPKSPQTVLGGMASADFPTVLATHRELEAWKTLMLEPSAMRAPSEYGDPMFIDVRGGNLPAAIERLRRRETHPGQVCGELANRLADLIDDVRSLRIGDDEKTETWTLEAQGRDGVFHPGRSLSDGTLRFLVLATLAIDPDTRGMISLEEPENGIHPERIPAMIRLLEDIAVDPELPVGEDNPLRQVIVNTHSPVVVRNVGKENLVYIKEQNVIRGRNRARIALVTVPKTTWRTAVADQPIPTADGDMAPYLDPSQSELPFLGR
jgi:predicted ATPase